QPSNRPYRYVRIPFCHVKIHWQNLSSRYAGDDSGSREMICLYGSLTVLVMYQEPISRCLCASVVEVRKAYTTASTGAASSTPQKLKKKPSTSGVAIEAQMGTRLLRFIR